MLKIGLTGGIASGKSLVADYFAKLGIKIIDADVIARKMVAPDTELFTKIVGHFGEKIIAKNGELDRTHIREIIFFNTSARKWLEELLHPVIYKAMQQEVKSATAPYCILVIPLLLETEHEHLVDRILIVDTPEESQIERLKQRDQIDDEQIARIMAAQITRAMRLEKANDIIINDQATTHVEEQVKKLHKKYLCISEHGRDKCDATMQS
ncbi:MAG: dephospho-CoA kinase [Gammaproteobacteria bacterium]|nr:dephospho-CoA kinase [Gammaproteobacteria bacterium]